MNDNRQKLEGLVAELQRAYDTALAKIVFQFPPGTDPNSVVDSNGRYILLDAMTALVKARTLLEKRHG